ncbi:MAG: PEP-CTERM sorting domain-containing protein [Chitinivibrionales bacterium]|nr:PEP-CTERM sorting domain-containing protein [Chitinivibrionales bacterium]
MSKFFKKQKNFKKYKQTVLEEKMNKFLAGLVAVGAMASLSFGDVITLSPTPSNIGSLNEGESYAWNITTLPVGVSYQSAELVINNLSESFGTPNALFVHLLANPVHGPKWWKNNGSPDVVYTEDALGMPPLTDDFNLFGFTNISLVTYNNITTPVTETWDFTGSQLSTLNSYAADGKIAIGFDPDCHFTNTGITLKLTTVPEPGMLTVLGLSLLGLLGLARRKK